MNIIDKLTKICPFPSIWEDKDENGRPRSELGYIRADHDGYRWWNTVWPVNKGLNDDDLIDEFDAVYNAFTEAFPSRTAMERYCMRELEPASTEGTEYNAYLDLDGPGFYWLRMITRKGDYNLYLHCYSKKAIQEESNESLQD